MPDVFAAACYGSPVRLSCPTCQHQPPRCDECLAETLVYLRSTAWVRGEDWARRVAAQAPLDQPWPPFEGRCAELARGKVRDLERRDGRICEALAVECHGYAARTWEKLRLSPR